MQNKRNLLTRTLFILPFLFLILAGVLYFHSIRTSEYAQTAKAIRIQASRPFAQVAIVYQLEGRGTSIVTPLPPNLAADLMGAMSNAQPMPPFEGTVEGDPFRIVVTHPEGTRTTFFAVRLDGDPETLYVGTVLPESISGTATNAAPHFTTSPPARVRGAGLIAGQVIDQNKAMGEDIPSDEEFFEWMKSQQEKGEG